jgi:ketosteroid isomerase-like protein
MTDRPSPLDVAHAYHDAWRCRDFAAASALLSPELVIEMPTTEYATREAFAEALAAFAIHVRGVDMLSEMRNGDETMQLYDMHVDGLGTLRVVEHLTVRDGLIVRIRHVHDTAALETWGQGSR